MKEKRMVWCAYCFNLIVIPKNKEKGKCEQCGNIITNHNFKYSTFSKEYLK